MKFEAEINLNYRQLLALYQVSERLFRRWQMLLFRVVCLAVGVWRVWKTWGDIQADGLSFTRVSYLLIGVLFLSAALIPNIISAGCARMRAMYSGKLHFTDRDFYEVVGGRTIRHDYEKVFALVHFRGYDFIFLDKLASLIVQLDQVPDQDPKELRSFLEKKCGQSYHYV